MTRNKSQRKKGVTKTGKEILRVNRKEEAGLTEGGAETANRKLFCETGGLEETLAW